jgi:two-component system, cell cycle response regulator
MIPVGTNLMEPAGMASILVVEDDTELLATLRVVLQQQKHVVQTATTNQRAHEIIAQGGLDLIISDAVLRGGNGENIATSADSLGVPILLISGDLDKIERLKDGPVPFLQKPFRPRALMTVVRRLLREAKD